MRKKHNQHYHKPKDINTNFIAKAIKNEQNTLKNIMYRIYYGKFLTVFNLFLPQIKKINI